MRLIIVYIVFILVITILLPITLTKGCDIGNKDNIVDKFEDDITKIEISEKKIIKIYNNKTKKVEDIEFEEYIKGVVSAEMPALFGTEAIKAQAVAARTFAYYRLNKYKDGHVDHPDAAICNSIHCQAYTSKENLRDKSEKWMYEYWPKIEEAVEATTGEILTYDGNVIEPLFHSTSGGKTENSEDYFVSTVPYLRSVESPYEEGAPKLNGSVTISINDFIKKLESNYKGVDLSIETLAQQIKSVEKSDGGRIKKIKIDNKIVSGRDIRTLFKLNSTNFKIYIHTKDKTVEIKTLGYGHGVGMSQWGANGMANNGSNYIEILKHYYTGVDIEKIY